MKPNKGALRNVVMTQTTGTSRRWLGATVGLLALVGSAASLVAQPRFEGLDWQTYANDEFGVSLSYPARLFKVEQVSERGDGQALVSRDGQARLLVGILDNEDRLSPEAYQKTVLRESYEGADIDYSPTGNTWFVLSGTLGDKIFYEKVMFGCDGAKLTSFALVYPTAKRKLYDAVVEHIEDSYRASFTRRGCR